MSGRLKLQSNHPVLIFAGEEWSRLWQLSGQAVDMTGSEVWIGTWEQFKADHKARLPASEWRDAGYSDEFFILMTETQLFLAGKSERGALYALYQWAQEEWGIHAIYPGAAPVLTHGKPEGKRQAAAAGRGGQHTGIRWYAPRMERRGFVFETINEPDYLKNMIEWFGHQKINEMFFTFSLWDQVGGELAEELIKRGIQVTLGGHSMKFLLDKGKDKDKTARTVEADHPYTAKEQLNFKDHAWQDRLLQDMAAYCKQVPNLARISLWPEDIADRDNEGFLEDYILFTEKLEAYLSQNGLDLEVEHIAYNAGLSWKMLERGKVESSAKVDTLYAYWGRDYRYGYKEDLHTNGSDRRALEAIEDWASATARADQKLTVFEYYSDHFMLSNLFPFLPGRILQDVAYYEQLNLLGMVNLVVPYRGEEPYPWKWVHGLNSYVFAKALWNDNLDEIMRDYYSCYAEHERDSVRALFDTIESVLPQVTSWNIPLFPARAADPEKATATPENKQAVLTMLREIHSRIHSVIMQSQLQPEGEPYRYAQHLLNYTKELEQRWMTL